MEEKFYMNIESPLINEKQRSITHNRYASGPGIAYRK